MFFIDWGFILESNSRNQENTFILSSIFLNSKLQTQLHADSQNEPSINLILIYFAEIFSTKMYANL